MPGITGVAALLPRARDTASMRPRLNAGDNERYATKAERYATASMRPRLNAGDNLKALEEGGFKIARASMRPRLNAGDNGVSHGSFSAFQVASMRPRLNAGDNVTGRAVDRGPRACFNEAPAKCRG